MLSDNDPEVEAIKAIIALQFASLSWNRDETGDWDAFQRDFFPNAALYASARPAQSQTVQAFIERLQHLSRTSLKSFDEIVLGTEVRVFGNVAVAVAACETTENEAEVNRNVEMMLLVKDEGHWKIVAQAWDKASQLRPIPSELLRNSSG